MKTTSQDIRATRSATLLRAALYGAGWLALAWYCLKGGHGQPLDHAVGAAGLAAVHLAAALLLAGAPRWLRVPGLVLYAPLAAATLLLLVFHGLYIGSGGMVSADALRAVAQTDPAEALAYVERLVSLFDMALAAGVLVLLGASFPWRPTRGAGLVANTLLVATGAIGLAFAHASTHSILGPIESYVAEYRDEMQAFDELVAAARLGNVSGASSDFEGTVVVVIGESVARRHMGRYGYWRDTTPYLEAREDEWIAFSDVVSAHSHTVPALKAALTSLGGGDAPPTDILSLARSAGFRTAWISNQNEFGVWDNGITVVARLADETRFLSHGVGRSFARTDFDEAILPELRAVLAKATAEGNPQRTLVFAHLFTNHWPYCSNVPEEKRHFEGGLGPRFFGAAREPHDVDCYDDGVRYTDWLLERIVQMTGEASGPAAVLYLSDHGEAPLLGTGHDSSKHSAYHIDIPFLFWANAAFAERYPEKLAAARANAGRPYTTARLLHALGDLLDIRHAAVDPTMSLFSRQLADAPRTSLHGAIRLDEWSKNNDFRENAAVNARALGPLRPAVWAHRTNTIGALMEASAVFAGVELDVVFMDAQRCFHVFHPPARDRGLSLEEALAAVAKRPGLRFWLDWKNATPQNLEPALGCLKALDRRFGLRGRTLVETSSGAVFPATRRISEAGFRHGYYLPTEKLLACMKSCDDAAAGALAASLRRIVEAGGYTGITFDWRTSGWVSYWLAEWARGRGLALYSWDLSVAMQGRAAPDAIERRLRSLGLEALLVTFPSPFRS